MYYMTVANDTYVHPPMPEGDEADRAQLREQIMRGMYRFRSITPDGWAEGGPKVNLLGSGAILNEVLEAQELLADQFGIASDVWSVTSWNELRRDVIEVDRWTWLHPAVGETGRASGRERG